MGLHLPYKLYLTKYIHYSNYVAHCYEPLLIIVLLQQGLCFYKLACDIQKLVMSSPDLSGSRHLVSK